MAQTVGGTMPAQGRLVVVPVPHDVADSDVLRAVNAFLAGNTGVPRCAAFVTWDEDGGLLARDIEPDSGEVSPVCARSMMRSALSALLAELFDTKLSASWIGAGDRGTSETHVDELSPSFLREVHEFVTPKTSFVALLTDWVDPGAIVHELRHIHSLRVIYGGVPQHWSASSA